MSIQSQTEFARNFFNLKYFWELNLTCSHFILPIRELERNLSIFFFKKLWKIAIELWRDVKVSLSVKKILPDFVTWRFFRGSSRQKSIEETPMIVLTRFMIKEFNAKQILWFLVLIYFVISLNPLNQTFGF